MDNITDPMNIWVRRELQRAVVVQARVQYKSARAAYYAIVEFT